MYSERINSQSQPKNFTRPRIFFLLVHMSDLGPYDSNLSERIFDCVLIFHLYNV